MRSPRPTAALTYLQQQAQTLREGARHGLAALETADIRGRVHVISPDFDALHTGHGNGMPQSLHGGPGRAGGGEGLGGVRALNFYHRRFVLKASTAVLSGAPE
jgi:3,4-dehydroadipyl-CoA semialdehyde dehydrogenase